MDVNGYESHEPARPVEQSLWRRIVGDEVYAATAIFAFVHRSCGEAVSVDRAGSLLSCWCDRCEDVRTYHVDD